MALCAFGGSTGVLLRGLSLLRCLLHGLVLDRHEKRRVLKGSPGHYLLDDLPD